MNTPDEAMTQEHTAIEVTQAARDAAADHMINCYANSAETAFAVRTGQRDDNWLVQAFARFERDTISRHRLAQPSITPAAGLVEALERNSGPLADAARRIAMRLSHTDNGQASAYAFAKADMLAAFTPPEQDRSTSEGEGE